VLLFENGIWWTGPTLLLRWRIGTEFKLLYDRQLKEAPPFIKEEMLTQHTRDILKTLIVASLERGP